MIEQFVDRVAGTAVYINPDYVVPLRPDPAGSALSSFATGNPSGCRATI